MPWTQSRPTVFPEMVWLGHPQPAGACQKSGADIAQARLGNILAFFAHRLTNGPIEGLNNKIQGLIKKAFGYRNKERFKNDIFFHLGGLDLYPAQ
ncbi:MAG TPA: transposase [Verrucomicrobiae bacterium]